jgi:hypothetical protein
LNRKTEIKKYASTARKRSARDTKVVLKEKGQKEMVKIEHVVTPSPEQWEAIIRGMRNPMNSWDKSDSYKTYVDDEAVNADAPHCFIVGDDDLTLMEKLASAGTDHRKYLRMIPVYMDITAPLYWWKEYDTYKVGTVANSCSTMHKIHEKEFTLDDFSHENLHLLTKYALVRTINLLNVYRGMYLSTKDKNDWWQMIQLLPSSYNQKRTVMLNYEVLRNMHHARRNHKLDEWRDFCKRIEDLPYSKLITG